MIGRTDRLEARRAVEHWKARGLDFSKILYQPDAGPEIGRYCQIPQDHGLDKSLDNAVLMDLCQPALLKGERVVATVPIKNVNRVVGTIVGSEVTRRYGPEGLPEDTIRIHFKGSAGQSFGAFMPKGMTFTLEGDANDYFAKGLSGGKVILYPPEGSSFVPEENMITGNVALYGATGGEVYIRGMAGERFAVRNSGVNAVVEAVGDHGCEYMTGGKVVILGPAGRNFAAGMSGGIAYVLDEKGDFGTRCNMQMVAIEQFEDSAEAADVRQMIQRHAEYTKSQRAWKILALWEKYSGMFVKVFPKDYKRMIACIAKAHAQGLAGEEAIMAAFEANSKDVARIGGG
jgi:glutamate synthase (ferredoxin)